ncbi:MAG: DUF929 family protein [Nitrososphaerales archaeon]
MPKCPKCGKKFGTLQALNDHFRSLHPGERFVAPKATSASRNFVVVIVIVIIVMGSLVGFLIYSQLMDQKPSTPPINIAILNQPISAALYQNLSGVTTATLNAVGTGGSAVTPPTRVSGAALTNDGKPEMLYIGAEFCPYCAAERWSMVIALSKFGTFSNIEYMASSANDVFANTPTFTFVNATYTSQYISFVSVEQLDRNSQPLQSTTSTQAALMNNYDKSNSIPFIDIGNNYSVVGSQYQPSTIDGKNWTQIGGQLNNASSLITKAIDGTANTLITAICGMDGQQPSSVCGQSFAKQPLLISPGNSFSSQPILSIPTMQENPRLEPVI